MPLYPAMLRYMMQVFWCLPIRQRIEQGSTRGWPRSKIISRISWRAIPSKKSVWKNISLHNTTKPTQSSSTAREVYYWVWLLKKTVILENLRLRRSKNVLQETQRQARCLSKKWLWNCINSKISLSITMQQMPWDWRG